MKEENKQTKWVRIFSNKGLQKTPCSTCGCLDSIYPLYVVHIFMLHTFVKTEPHFLRTGASPVTYYEWAKRSYQIKVTDRSGPALQAHTGHQTMQKPCSGSVHKCEQRATRPCPISQYLCPVIYSHNYNPSKPDGGLLSFSHFMISALPAFTAHSSIFR